MNVNQTFNISELGWKETRVPKVVSLNPGTEYWMDILTYLFVVKFVMCF